MGYRDCKEGREGRYFVWIFIAGITTLIFISHFQLGIRASSTCTLNLDDVKVPLENLVGEEGKGYKYAIEILNEGTLPLDDSLSHGCSRH